MFLFHKYNLFVAIIGDIRNSKNLLNRKSIQDSLKQVLEDINKEYAEDIAAKFLITLGDEFQGLLRNSRNIVRIIEAIKIKMYPVEIRFGVGIGEITTDINSEMALGADGPGYYKAREAIELLKENEKKNKTVISDIRVECEAGNNSQIVLINTVFELIRVIEQNWSERQRQIIWNIQIYQDGQKRTAERLGVTQSSVNKALANGNYYAYAKALKDVENILGES